METDCCAQNGNTHAHAFITFKCWFLTERNWVKSCHVCAQNGNTHAHAFITFKCWFLTERNWMKICHVCLKKNPFLSAGPVMFFFGLVFPLNINFLLCSLLPYISFVLIHMWEKTAPRDVSPTCWETLDCSCFRIEENSNELPSSSRYSEGWPPHSLQMSFDSYKFHKTDHPWEPNRH